MRNPRLEAHLPASSQHRTQLPTPLDLIHQTSTSPKKSSRASTGFPYRGNKSLGEDAVHESARSVRVTAATAAIGSPQFIFARHHKEKLNFANTEEVRKARTREFSERNMRCSVQVLTTPTSDTLGTTLLLSFDDKRYLVGSFAEGTQRACVQMGANIGKVEQCFITGRTEWSNIGGLIGMILTLADTSKASHTSTTDEIRSKIRRRGIHQGWSDSETVAAEEEAVREMKSQKLTLFGPPNLNHTLATARRFIFRKGMPLEINEIRENDDSGSAKADEEWAPTWADEHIKVWSMPILPSSGSAGFVNSSRDGSTGSRKRSFDEVDEKATSNDPTSAGQELSPRQRDLLATKAVVAEMFDSAWRLDTLYETPLSEVNLPAAIFIRNSETHKLEQYQGPLPGQTPGPEDPGLPVLVRRPWPGAMIQQLPSTEPALEAVSYIIRNHAQRGKFQIEKALKLNIQDKRHYSLLHSGQSVINKDGITVTPDMVLGETREGGGFAVIDLPDPSYIDSLINRREWMEPKVMAGVGGMFWICGKGVASDARVHKFMQQFKHIEHIVSSPDYCTNNIVMDSVAITAAKFKQLDPARYDIPFHDLSDPSHGLLPLPTPVHVAKRGLSLQLEPKRELEMRNVVEPIHFPDVKVTDVVLEEATRARKAVEADASQNAEWVASILDKDAEIFTLGTGSSLPSKYRNVSSTLVRVPAWGCLIFDAGESTMGQLRRVFPPEELSKVLKSLRAIFISHMHADHHLGLTGVIRAWYEEVHGAKPAPLSSTEFSSSKLLMNRDRLSVVAESAMQQWLAEYAAVEDYGFSRILPVLCKPERPAQNQGTELRWFRRHSERASASEDMQQRTIIEPGDLDFQDIQAVNVSHCHDARAYSVTLPSGFKVSYSGDCRPSRKFALIGKGSTVCIHEATFDDEMLGDAKYKRHSTTSEALGVAQAMEAKACVLTHFSQRYQKLPVMERQRNHNNSVAVLEDDDNIIDDGNVDVAPFEQDPSLMTEQQQGIRKSHGLAETRDFDVFAFKLSSDMKVCVASDYMRIKVGDIWQAEKFTPALSKLFAEEEAKKLDEKEAHKVDELVKRKDGKQKHAKAKKTRQQQKVNEE